MPKIKIGLAGWYERYGLYPSWCRSPADKLGFYAQEFPVAEVDSTYYAIPNPTMTTRWARCTPNEFVFNVKAFRLFTGHHTAPDALPSGIRDKLPPDLAGRRYIYYFAVPTNLRDGLWQEFERTLAPLRAIGKLGVVLFQFPPSFRPSRESVCHIVECKRRLPDYRIAVEFRNRWWFDSRYFEKTLTLLRNNELEYVAVDEPQGFNSSVPAVAEVTGMMGVVRFHGRNDAKWEKKGLRSSAERFDYYYSPGEMSEWVPRIRSMERHSEEVHVIMNTNNHDQGTYNARLLAALLGEGLNERATLF